MGERVEKESDTLNPRAIFLASFSRKGYSNNGRADCPESKMQFLLGKLFFLSMAQTETSDAHQAHLVKNIKVGTAPEIKINLVPTILFL